jgi:hypothetical protein
MEAVSAVDMIAVALRGMSRSDVIVDVVGWRVRK